MKKGVGVWLLVIILLITGATPVGAFDGDVHDTCLEWVLFGDENYKKSLSKTDEKRKAIEALEAASYLCLDQVNGKANDKGQKKLDLLRGYGVSGIQENILDAEGINFSFFGGDHRQYTHKGWGYKYEKKGEGIANWPKRKEILQSTVDTVFENDNFIQSMYEDVVEVFDGNMEEEKQYDSFCSLLYYIHILGDQIDRKEYEENFTVVSFIKMSGRGEGGIIEELLDDFKALFPSQVNKKEYKSLVRKMKALKMEAEKYSKDGGLYIPDNFNKYKECEKEFLKILGQYVPKLLENEKFFNNVFY